MHFFSKKLANKTLNFVHFHLPNQKREKRQKSVFPQKIFMKARFFKHAQKNSNIPIFYCFKLESLLLTALLWGLFVKLFTFDGGNTVRFFEKIAVENCTFFTFTVIKRVVLNSLDFYKTVFWPVICIHESHALESLLHP